MGAQLEVAAAVTRVVVGVVMDAAVKAMASETAMTASTMEGEQAVLTAGGGVVVAMAPGVERALN